MLNFYIERVLTIRSSGLPKAALLPSAELKRCYDFRGQELGEDFLRFHPFFTLLIGRGGASKDDGGTRGYPWVGSPLTGVRQGPASPEGRGL
jgi:hypothetical protein